MTNDPTSSSSRDRHHEIQDYTTLMSEQLSLIEALYEIAMSDDNAEMVRVAMAALTSTTSGLAFLSTHPITL